MDKKNTLLLTVIAIATLLVAVVGATFAFFTAQNAANASTNITVKTETTNSATFNSDKAITIKADMSNFAESNVGESREEGTFGEASPTVTLTSGSSAESGADMCYEVSFVVNPISDVNKRFDYSTANAESKPELVLYIEKTPGVPGEDDSSGNNYIEDNDGDKGVAAAITKITTPKELTYSTEIGETTDDPKEKGFDITKSQDATEQEYKIPTIDSLSSELNYKHKISVSEASKTVIDKWKIRVVMINYNFDQERNAGKEFKGEIRFHQLDSCD